MLLRLSLAMIALGSLACQTEGNPSSLEGEAPKVKAPSGPSPAASEVAAVQTPTSTPAPPPTTSEPSTELPAPPPVDSPNEPPRPTFAAPATLPEAVAVPMPRAPAAWAGAVEQARSIGLRQPGVEAWRALEGRAVTPDWAAPSRGEGAARDDDLLTGWSCEPTSERSCAWALVLPEPATVTAVRVYFGTVAHKSRRVTALRIHTDAGYVDTKAIPGRKHRTLVFGAPITTRTLALEVLKVAGKKDPVRLAEVELFGTHGVARAPLDLDPGSAHVFAAAPWVDDKLRPDLCMHTIAADGRRPCSLRATALYGRPGDRFLLAELVYRDPDYGEPNGAYMLIDQHTRRTLRLDGLGRPPGRILRHAEGLGFASLSKTGLHEPERWSGVQWKDGALATWSNRTTHDLERALDGFEFFADGRGGTKPEQPSSGTCEPIEAYGSDGRFDRILRALESTEADVESLRARQRETEEAEPYVNDTMWCPLGDPEAGVGVAILGEGEGELHRLLLVGSDEITPLMSVGAAVRGSRLRDGRLLLAMSKVETPSEQTPSEGAEARQDSPEPDLAPLPPMSLYVVDRGGEISALATDMALAVPLELDEAIDDAIEIPPMGSKRDPKVLSALARLPARARRALLDGCGEMSIHAIWHARVTDDNGDGHLDANITSTESETLTWTCDLTSTRGGGYRASIEMESSCDEG